MAAITDRAMQAAAKERDIWLNEGFGRGLGALRGRITPSGTRTFYFRYAGPSGQKSIPVGPFAPKGDGVTAFTVAQAREKARTWAALKRDQGISDLAEHFARQAEDRQRAEEAARALEIAAREAELAATQAEAEALQRRKTVRQLFNDWQAAALRPAVRADGRRTGRKDGGEYVRQQFERHVFPAIGAQPLAELRKGDILPLLDRQTAAGKLRTAKVLLSDLKQMLDFAVDRDLLPANPLATLRKSKVGGMEAPRERVLSEAELATLARALPQAGMSRRSACAIWLILATGVRVGECMRKLPH